MILAYQTRVEKVDPRDKNCFSSVVITAGKEILVFSNKGRRLC